MHESHDNERNRAQSSQPLIRSPSLESISDHGSDVGDLGAGEDIRLGLLSLSRKTKHRNEEICITETGDGNRLLIFGILREVSTVHDVFKSSKLNCIPDFPNVVFNYSRDGCYWGAP